MDGTASDNPSDYLSSFQKIWCHVRDDLRCNSGGIIEPIAAVATATGENQ